MDSDKLLDLMFSDLSVWEDAINRGIDKKIRTDILQLLTMPSERASIKEQIQNRTYHVSPPHEAQIPKDDGTMRTVYVNEAKDRVILAVINTLLFRTCPDMVHPKCMSYQEGIGCGKIDRQVIEDLDKVPLTDDLGYKLDLSKYFDSVKIEYIDEIFDKVEQRHGKSAVIDLLREYYHDDTLLDMNKNEIHKFTSLRQGCAVAAFLADSVLYDMDETLSNMDVVYYRYSDDILLIGHNSNEAFKVISDILEKKSLPLNPKKVEKLDRKKWFTFLGFSIKDGTLTLSKKRVKNLQKEIESRTIKSQNKKLSPESALRSVYLYLYDNSITKYGYADGILPVITSDHDMSMLDAFIMDCVRAVGTKKNRVGGLGYDKSGKDGVIVRGKGRNVRTNRQKSPIVNNYRPLSFMKSLYVGDRTAYNAVVKEMIL